MKTSDVIDLPTTLCRLEHVTVRFGCLAACREASLDLAPGEVHALVGENGAGKSTLMHALAGIVRTAAGRIAVAGADLPPGDPRAARRAGVAMVFQRFRLVPALTVAENVILGLKQEPFWLAPARLARRVQETADRLGIELRAEARVADLGESARQQVEILRVFYRGARLLILDEPTSVLTPPEAERLMAGVRRYAAEGVGVYLISHKLPEVLAVADRISVMRRGEVVARDLRPRECSLPQLAALMVGEGATTIDLAASPAAKCPSLAAPMLALAEVSLRPAGLRERLERVTLEVRAGEIVGVAGVSGNGQRLLAHVAAGLMRPASGRVRVGGRDLTGRGVRAFLDAGVGYAPENRDRLAVARGLSVIRNAVLRSYRRRGPGESMFLSARRLAERAGGLIAGADVRVPGLDALAATLSGGNLQKLVLARETAQAPRLLVVDQPTQGLDIAASQRVRARLAELRDQGVAILLVSSDLDEILALADRLVVMVRGSVCAVPGRAPFERQAVGRLMLGGTARAEEAAHA